MTNVNEPIVEIAGLERTYRQRRVFGKVVPASDVAGELMTLVGLSFDRLDSHPHAFSGGERQRLAIARSLVSGPRVLILDEAFSGLDLATRDHIIGLLKRLKTSQGLTYVCISHDEDLLASFATEIAVMHGGRIESHQPVLVLDGAVA